MSRRDFLKMVGIGAAGIAAEACAAENPLLHRVMSELEKERMPRPKLRVETASAVRGYDEYSEPLTYQGSFESNAGEGEYFLSQSDSPFREAEGREGDIGAREFLYQLGFHVEESLEPQRILVFEQFKQKAEFLLGVSEEFKQVIYKIVKELLNDKIYLNLITKHLSRGEFVFFPDHGGHYDEKRIEIGKGPEESEEKIKGVIIHELLHGVSAQLELFQHGSGGGADHRIILPLESRIYFTETLLSGASPFKQNDIKSFSGHTSTFDRSKLEPTAEFQRCIDANDLYGLIKYIELGNFAESKTMHEIGNEALGREMFRQIREHSVKKGDFTVRITEEKFVPVSRKVDRFSDGKFIGITLGDVDSDEPQQLEFIKTCEQEFVPEVRKMFQEALSQMKADKDLGQGYIFSDAEIRDIAHIIAVKNAVIAESSRLAALVAKKKSLKIEDAPADKDFQKIYRNFLSVFSQAMVETKTPPPFFLARRAMDACLAEK